MRPVDFTHAAGAEGGENFVRAEPRAGEHRRGVLHHLSGIESQAGNPITRANDAQRGDARSDRAYGPPTRIIIRNG